MEFAEGTLGKFCLPLLGQLSFVPLRPVYSREEHGFLFQVPQNSSKVSGGTLLLFCSPRCALVYAACSPHLE